MLNTSISDSDWLEWGTVPTLQVPPYSWLALSCSYSWWIMILAPLLTFFTLSTILQVLAPSLLVTILPRYGWFSSLSEKFKRWLNWLFKFGRVYSPTLSHEIAWSFSKPLWEATVSIWMWLLLLHLPLLIMLLIPRILICCSLETSCLTSYLYLAVLCLELN